MHVGTHDYAHKLNSTHKNSLTHIYSHTSTTITHKHVLQYQQSRNRTYLLINTFTHKYASAPTSIYSHSNTHIHSQLRSHPHLNTRVCTHTCTFALCERHSLTRRTHLHLCTCTDVGI